MPERAAKIDEMACGRRGEWVGSVVGGEWVVPMPEQQHNSSGGVMTAAGGGVSALGRSKTTGEWGGPDDARRIPTQA